MRFPVQLTLRATPLARSAEVFQVLSVQQAMLSAPLAAVSAMRFPVQLTLRATQLARSAEVFPVLSARQAMPLAPLAAVSAMRFPVRRARSGVQQDQYPVQLDAV